MARPRSPNRDKAYKLYKRHNGNISNKEIANIIQEDPKTISKWKQLDKWDQKLTDSKNNSNNSEAKTSYDYECEHISEEDIVIEKEVNAIEETEELTEKQLLFCILYTKYFNATKAYQKAYECNNISARVNGSRLLANANIQIAIAKLKQNRLNQMLLAPEDIFQMYLDIACVDMHDYASLRTKEVVVGMDGKGLPIYQRIQTLEFKDSDQTDGTLITEIKEGKYGISIKLADRMKAMDWLSKHMGMATEEQRARVEAIRSKMENEKEILELKRKEFERNDW